MKNYAIYIRVGTAKQLNKKCAKGDKRYEFANSSAAGGHCNTGNDNRKNA